MKTFTTFSLILLSTSTYVNALPAALPVGNFTFPLIRLEGTGAYLNGAADTSHARARFLKSRTPTGPSESMPMFSSAPYFVMQVGVGEPDSVSYQDLIVDTGSSVTWMMEYTKMSPSKSTGQKVKTTYANGAQLEGSEYLDDVTLAPGLVISKQSIGIISPSSIKLELLNFHGVLGLGPVSLTKGALHPKLNALIPTVMNNLKSQESIEEEVFGVYIPPITSPEETEGSLIYGGTDPNLYEGNLLYFPLTKTSPASQHWGIDLSSCMYGSRTIISTLVAGIVDTGDPMIVLADDFFQLYMNELKILGATLDSEVTGLIEIPPSSVQHMQSLHFKFGEHKFTLDVDSQLLPQRMNTEWLGDPEKRYGLVFPMGHNSGHGFDFILGRPFLEKYYTVSSGSCFEKSMLNGRPWQAYDAERQQIGFAPAIPPDQLNTARKSKSPSPTTSSAPTTSSDSA
ncbi:Aspartic peptidase domain containing protein [Tylopilus felleus]